MCLAGYVTPGNGSVS